jgi:hypothetical protein
MGWIAHLARNFSYGVFVYSSGILDIIQIILFIYLGVLIINFMIMGVDCSRLPVPQIPQIQVP